MTTTTTTSNVEDDTMMDAVFRRVTLPDVHFNQQQQQAQHGARPKALPRRSPPGGGTTTTQQQLLPKQASLSPAPAVTSEVLVANNDHNHNYDTHNSRLEISPTPHENDGRLDVMAPTPVPLLEAFLIAEHYAAAAGALDRRENERATKEKGAQPPKSQVDEQVTIAKNYYGLGRERESIEVTMDLLATPSDSSEAGGDAQPGKNSHQAGALQKEEEEEGGSDNPQDYDNLSAAGSEPSLNASQVVAVAPYESGPMVEVLVEQPTNLEGNSTEPHGSPTINNGGGGGGDYGDEEGMSCSPSVELPIDFSSPALHYYNYHPTPVSTPSLGGRRRKSAPTLQRNLREAVELLPSDFHSSSAPNTPRREGFGVEDEDKWIRDFHAAVADGKPMAEQKPDFLVMFGSTQTPLIVPSVSPPQLLQHASGQEDSIAAVNGVVEGTTGIIGDGHKAEDKEGIQRRRYLKTPHPNSRKASSLALLQLHDGDSFNSPEDSDLLLTTENTPSPTIGEGGYKLTNASEVEKVDGKADGREEESPKKRCCSCSGDPCHTSPISPTAIDRCGSCNNDRRSEHPPFPQLPANQLCPTSSKHGDLPLLSHDSAQMELSLDGISPSEALRNSSTQNSKEDGQRKEHVGRENGDHGGEDSHPPYNKAILEVKNGQMYEQRQREEENGDKKGDDDDGNARRGTEGKKLEEARKKLSVHQLREIFTSPTSRPIFPPSPPVSTTQQSRASPHHLHNHCGTTSSFLVAPLPTILCIPPSTSHASAANVYGECGRNGEGNAGRQKNREGEVSMETVDETQQTQPNKSMETAPDQANGKVAGDESGVEKTAEEEKQPHTGVEGGNNLPSCTIAPVEKAIATQPRNVSLAEVGIGGEKQAKKEPSPGSLAAIRKSLLYGGQNEGGGNENNSKKEDTNGGGYSTTTPGIGERGTTHDKQHAQVPTKEQPSPGSLAAIRKGLLSSKTTTIANIHPHMTPAVGSEKQLTPPKKLSACYSWRSVTTTTTTSPSPAGGGVSYATSDLRAKNKRWVSSDDAAASPTVFRHNSNPTGSPVVHAGSPMVQLRPVVRPQPATPRVRGGVDVGMGESTNISTSKYSPPQRPTTMKAFYKAWGSKEQPLSPTTTTTSPTADGVGASLLDTGAAAVASNKQ